MHCLQREVGGMATKKCDGCCWPARGRVGLITTSLERSCLNKLIKQWGLNSSRHFVGPLRFILVHVEQYILFIIRSRVSAGGFWEVPYLASAFYVWSRKGEDLLCAASAASLLSHSTDFHGQTQNGFLSDGYSNLNRNQKFLLEVLEERRGRWERIFWGLTLGPPFSCLGSRLLLPLLSCSFPVFLFAPSFLQKNASSRQSFPFSKLSCELKTVKKEDLPPLPPLASSTFKSLRVCWELQCTLMSSGVFRGPEGSLCRSVIPETGVGISEDPCRNRGGFLSWKWDRNTSLSSMEAGGEG